MGVAPSDYLEDQDKMLKVFPYECVPSEKYKESSRYYEDDQQYIQKGKKIIKTTTKKTPKGNRDENNGTSR